MADSSNPSDAGPDKSEVQYGGKLSPPSKTDKLYDAYNLESIPAHFGVLFPDTKPDPQTLAEINALGKLSPEIRQEITAILHAAQPAAGDKILEKLNATVDEREQAARPNSNLFAAANTADGDPAKLSSSENLAAALLAYASQHPKDQPLQTNSDPMKAFYQLAKMNITPGQFASDIAVIQQGTDAAVASVNAPDGDKENKLYPEALRAKVHDAVAELVSAASHAIETNIDSHVTPSHLTAIFSSSVEPDAKPTHGLEGIKKSVSVQTLGG